MMIDENTLSEHSIQHGPIQPDIMNQLDYHEYIAPWNSLTRKGAALFYEFRTANELNRPLLMVPDTCMDIIVECDPDNPSIFCLGPTFELKNLNLKPNTLYFGFKPYTEKGMTKKIVSHFKDLGNDLVNLQDLMNIGGLFESLVSQQNFTDRIRVFRTFAQKQFIDYEYQPDFIERLVCLLCANWDNLSLVDIYEEVGYSARYCRQVFNETYGISPKQYLRIMRFQNTISSFSPFSSSSYSNINESLRFHYYDQSHSIKDFRSFTNMAPAEFKKYILTS